MTLCTHRICGFIRLLLLSLAFPWGGLCGGREEVLAKGWTLDLLIERFNQREKVVIAYDLEHPSSKNWGGDGPYFSRLFGMIEKLGDRAALPFLEEKSFMTNAPVFVRSRAAEAYVKIADVEEGFEFMRKIYETQFVQGSRRYFLNKKFLEKVGAEEKTLTPETKENIASFLLGIVQNVESSNEANDADRFLLDRISEYANSKQRATLVRYANTGNEWVTNTYNPIKAHFDKIPPGQRIDLRERFPNLPPLPDDAPAGDGGSIKALSPSL
ncbi:MAG TPA: hypothetical protein PK576_03140 [Kiritimatiellia bacterium]|nr:hypothetical protein [Kiritimatiellia bacterium]